MIQCLLASNLQENLLDQTKVPVIRGRENGAEEWMQAFGGYVVTGFWKSELEATKKF
jgi:hypothetical protein